MDGERSEHALRLQGYALCEKLTVLPELGVAIITLDRAELQRFRHQPGDTEGLVNLGLSIAGVRLSAFLVEREDHIKVSLRSLGTLPVDGLMRDHFGGGGHVNAAGGRFDGPLEEAVRKLRALLPALMEHHPA
jgi:phosphoesterase RecJ-like protein